MREREQRFPTNTAVEITHSGNVYQAVACDISLNGACIFGMPRLSPNSQVTLYCLGWATQARIAWSKDLFTGLKFAVPLDPVDLQTLLAVSAAGLKTVA